jgi:endonuclease/exonuclease/phosphatase (EEP) superfamily protein YafD
VRKAISRIIRSLAWASGITGLLALLLRLTVYDDVPAPWHVLAYVTPLPVILILLLPWWAVLRHAATRAATVLLLLIAAWWVLGSWKWPHQPSAQAGRKPFSFLYWTADHLAFLDADTAASWLKTQEADLMVFGEAAVDYGRQKAAFTRLFPGHKQIILSGGYWMLYKGEIVRQESRWLATIERPPVQPGRKPVRLWPTARAYLTLVDMKDPAGGDFTLALFDHFSTPTMTRAPALHELTAAMRDLVKTNPRLLLAGDFNTPSDSRHLRDMRTFLTNAFEAAGSGTAATWPAGFPLLALDQIWTHGFTPLSCTHRYSSLLGHESVSCLLAVPSP